MKIVEPIPKELLDQMNAVAVTLNDIFKPYGFALLVFDFGDNGRLNYISNAERETIIATMKEFIAVQEGRAFNDSSV